MRYLVEKESERRKIHVSVLKEIGKKVIPHIGRYDIYPKVEIGDISKGLLSLSACVEFKEESNTLPFYRQELIDLLDTFTLINKILNSYL